MKCERCMFYSVESYDPSPSGVGLSAGSFSEPICNHPDFDKFPSGWFGNGKCRCGTKAYKRFCTKHGAFNSMEYCPKCEHEAEVLYEAISKEMEAADANLE